MHTTLPKFTTQFTALKFSPCTPTLAITLTSNELYIYDYSTLAFTPWTQENSSTRLPKWLLSRHEIINGISFCGGIVEGMDSVCREYNEDGSVDTKPKEMAEQLMIWGTSYSCFVDLNNVKEIIRFFYLIIFLGSLHHISEMKKNVNETLNLIPIPRKPNLRSKKKPN